MREIKGLVTGGGGLWVKVRGILACCNQALSQSDSSALVYSRL